MNSKEKENKVGGLASQTSFPRNQHVNPVWPNKHLAINMEWGNYITTRDQSGDNTSRFWRQVSFQGNGILKPLGKGISPSTRKNKDRITKDTYDIRDVFLERGGISYRIKIEGIRLICLGQ